MQLNWPNIGQVAVVVVGSIVALSHLGLKLIQRATSHAAIKLAAAVAATT